jgi:uncharacterized RDD family membrane protein YckC
MGDAFNPYEAPRADAGRAADPFASRVGGAADASRGIRLTNLLIDSFCRVIIGTILGVIAGTANSPLLAIVLSLTSMIGYYLFFEGLFQATPGKFITRTRVVDRDGNRPSFGSIVGRTLARFVPFEPFSFFSSTQEGWHDRWSGTRVVKK